MIEADPDGFSFEEQSAFDVADMIKQYFRDLPEPIFSSKLCESFLHIYQCKLSQADLVPRSQGRQMFHEASLSLPRHLVFRVGFHSLSHPFILCRLPKGSTICSSPGCHLPPAGWEPRSSSVPSVLPAWSSGLCEGKPDDSDEYRRVLGPISVPSQRPQERQRQQQVFEITLNIRTVSILKYWMFSDTLAILKVSCCLVISKQLPLYYKVQHLPKARNNPYFRAGLHNKFINLLQESSRSSNTYVTECSYWLMRITIRLKFIPDKQDVIFVVHFSVKLDSKYSKDQSEWKRKRFLFPEQFQIDFPLQTISSPSMELDHEVQSSQERWI